MSVKSVGVSVEPQDKARKRKEWTQRHSNTRETK